MCGIAGVWNRKSDKTPEKGVIKAMCDSIIHRGPDEEGFYLNQGIGLGHRRLDIIDI